MKALNAPFLVNLGTRLCILTKFAILVCDFRFMFLNISTEIDDFLLKFIVFFCVFCWSKNLHKHFKWLKEQFASSVRPFNSSLTFEKGLCKTHWTFSKKYIYLRNSLSNWSAVFCNSFANYGTSEERSNVKKVVSFYLKNKTKKPISSKQVFLIFFLFINIQLNGVMMDKKKYH